MREKAIGRDETHSEKAIEHVHTLRENDRRCIQKHFDTKLSDMFTHYENR